MRAQHWLITRSGGVWTAEYVSANGSVITKSRPYKTHASALYGIGSVMGSAVERTPAGRRVKNGGGHFIPVLLRELDGPTT